MIQILSAATKKGEIIIAANFPRAFLNDLKTNTTFICVQCKEQVILKNGLLKTPHFAHTRNTSCPQTFSEGESEDHLNGKLQLYELLKKHSKGVQLEAFLSFLPQRPDLYIQSKPFPIAVEFQCSQIPVSEMQRRTMGYATKKIVPIWILRTPNLSNFPLQEIGTMQLSAFRQQFFYSTPNGNLILTYCPQSKDFHYISNPMHLKANNYIVKVKRLPMEKQSWPFAIIKRSSWEDFQKYLSIYKHHRFKQLDNLYFYNRKGIQSPFLQICYRWGIHPSKLPFYIGIPTKQASVFSKHAVEWQLEFIDYLGKLDLSIQQATIHHCKSFLFYMNIIPNPSEAHLKAVESYLSLLQQCLISSEKEIYTSNIDYTLMKRLLYAEFLAN